MAELVVAGSKVLECEICGHVVGPGDLVELLALQRDAEDLGCSPHSYPLASFIESLPGVKLLGDSGGKPSRKSLPFVSFELSDHRTWQLENLGQALRLVRDELHFEWTLEFTFDFQLGFELHPRNDPKTHDDADCVAKAREDMTVIWRRLQGYAGLSWWKHQ